MTAVVDSRSGERPLTANETRLAECTGPHRFRLLPETGTCRDRYACERCQGEIDGKARRWYVRGLRRGLGLFQRGERGP